MDLHWQTWEDGITALDAGFIRRGLAAIHIIEDHGELAIVDCGTAHSVPLILAWLARNGFRPEQVRHVFLTHIHLDHAGGAGALLQALPAADLLVHPRGAAHLIAPERLVAATIEVYGAERFTAHYGKVLPITAERIIETTEGHSAWLGTRRFRFMDAPGHARHHLAIFDEHCETAFTGDCFGLSYRELDSPRGAFIIPTTSPSQFDPDAAHATVDRVAAWAPKTVCLSHYSRLEWRARLVDDLHTALNAFTAMALAAETAHARRQTLVARLRDWCQAQLQRHGCVLEASAIDAVLGMDLELNADGLLLWADRQRLSS